MSEKVRQILKEAWQTTQAKIALDKNFFGNIQDKPSNLGCLEFRYQHDDKDIDQVIQEMTPFLNDIGIKYISVIKMSSTVVMTVTHENAEEAKKLAKKFGLQLGSEKYSNEKMETNPLKKQNDPTASGVPTKHFSDYGRSSSDGRGTYSGGILGSSMPINKLAGE